MNHKDTKDTKEEKRKKNYPKLLTQTTRELMELTRTQLADVEEQEKVLELIDKILVYKFPKLSRQELEAMFGLDDLKQTRYFQDVMEEGSLKTLVKIFCRFANVPPNIGEKLNNIKDLSFLDSLIKKAVTVQNIAEFQQLLQEVTSDK